MAASGHLDAAAEHRAGARADRVEPNNINNDNDNNNKKKKKKKSSSSSSSSSNANNNKYNDNNTNNNNNNNNNIKNVEPRRLGGLPHDNVLRQPLLSGKRRDPKP